MGEPRNGASVSKKRMPADSRRRGRGRLMAIEQLPPEADGDVAWAVEMLNERRATQLNICAELNRRLAKNGISERVSRSAFNRLAIRVEQNGQVPDRFLRKVSEPAGRGEKRSMLGLVVRLLTGGRP